MAKTGKKYSDIPGREEEIKFWKGFIKTPRFLDGWVPKIKTPELRQEVADFIVQLQNEFPECKVADVGSGVVSILNGVAKNLDAFDPLAEDYFEIFDYSKHGVDFPAAVSAEDFHSEHSGKYDIVHISNALDHVQDIIKAFRSLAVATQKYLIIQGFENEGYNQNFEGMHQNNIVLRGSELWANGMLLNDMGAIIPHRIWTHNFEGRNWFIWIGKKQSYENK